MIIQHKTRCLFLLLGGLLLFAPLAKSASVQELTLSEAIEMALAGNPELSALASDEGAAAARSDAALGRRLPRLDFVASGKYFMQDQRLLPASKNAEMGAFSDQILAGDVVLSLPLYSGGKRVIAKPRRADLQCIERLLPYSGTESGDLLSRIFTGGIARAYKESS
jgi:outer membrane protein TolC